MAIELSQQAFERLDEQNDRLFYGFPRFTVHIDSRAIRLAGEIFARYLPLGGRLLDLLSSWRSHLPETLAPASVTGVGLNRLEMEDNPALTRIVVQDLNRTPRLELEDRSFDGAILTVSVQYLTQPVALFADTARVLCAGAPFVVLFSNRMFWDKAVRIWRESSEARRIEVVKSYFQHSERFERLEVVDRSEAAGFDPVYAVIGWRRDD
jgi:SAM-dependent methyltransferase